MDMAVRSYPTILALHWPGASPDEKGKPAKKNLSHGHDVECLVDEAQGIFGSAWRCGGPDVGEQRELSMHNMEVAPAEGQEAGGGGVTCRDRVEDAVASVRFFLRNDVFIETTLSKERMGEWSLGGILDNQLAVIPANAGVLLALGSLSRCTR